MATNIIMPQAGQDIEDGRVIKWHKKVGDCVKEREVILDVETDKAVFSVESPADGVLLKIIFKEDEIVHILATVGIIGEPGEKIDDIKIKDTEQTPDDKQNKHAIKESSHKELAQKTYKQTVTKKSGETLISPRARTLARELDVNISTLDGTGPGGRITEKDVRNAVINKESTHESHIQVKRKRKVIILGGGPGGTKAALRVMELGGEAVLIENGAVGGVCLNRGCIPSKALLKSAEIYRTVLESGDFGVDTEGVSISLDKMMNRKNRIVETNRKALERSLLRAGIELIYGRGRLTGSASILVNLHSGEMKELSGDAVIIATGSDHFIPDFMKIDHERIITSDEALAVREIPPGIIIIGASVLGCEFAVLFGLLGSRVTMVEIMPNILHSFDEEISTALTRNLKKMGIQIFTGTRIIKASCHASTGYVDVVLSNGKTLTAEYCLCAVGRKPNVEGIGLEEAGILYDTKGVTVSDTMETNVKYVYAVGDLNGRWFLEHAADEQGKVAAENAMGVKSIFDDSALPSCIFTRPNIGAVGLTEKKAEEEGFDVVKGIAHFRSSAVSHALGEIEGFVKVVAEKTTGRIVGVHIIGPRASELIAEGTLAVRNNLTLNDIIRTFHAHPTYPEVFREACIEAAERMK